jgi:hypothetical protein
LGQVILISINPPSHGKVQRAARHYLEGTILTIHQKIPNSR